MRYAPCESFQNIFYATAIFPCKEFESSPDHIGLSVEQSRFIFFDGMQREAQAFRHRHLSISFKCFFAEQS
jgi:hypothetical protein